MPRGQKIPYEENHRINKKGELEKKCNICNEWFLCTEEYFYKNKHNKSDGLYPNCINCSINKFKQWAKDNKEQHNENNRKAYEENKWDVKGIMRNNAKRRRENGDYRKWQQENPEKIKENNLYRSLHKKHNINKKEWEACLEYFNYSCAYCNLSQKESLNKFKEKLHKEHVDNEGENSLSNCVPSCKECNSEKHTHKLNQWYNESNLKYTSDNFNKIIRWITEDYKLFLKANK